MDWMSCPRGFRKIIARTMRTIGQIAIYIILIQFSICPSQGWFEEKYIFPDVFQISPNAFPMTINAV
jgi:hypothetical protein